MRILFFGSGEFGIPTLRNLCEHHQVLRVVTQPDRPSGRGRKPAPTPLKAKANELGLQVLAVENANDPALVRELLDLNAQLGVVMAFGQKIGSDMLSGIAGGCINAHASLLPKYRGAAPIHWAIMNGEERTGVTVFKLIDRMDAGPILTQRWTLIKPAETTEELHDRLAGVAVDAIGAALDLYEKDPHPPGKPQNESEATPAKKLKKEDGCLDFHMPADQLANLICGLWPWPGARCKYVNANGSKREDVILARARTAKSPTVELSPGGIDSRMMVATAQDSLEILEIKPAGGKLMSWADFVNGRHVLAGDCFESLAASQ